MTVKQIADLPAPPARFPLGHLKTLRRDDMHHQLLEWSKQYNGLYKVRVMHKTLIAIGQGPLIQQILKQRPDVFRRRSSLQSVFQELGMNGLFSAEGERWQQQRTLFNPAFSGGHLRSFFPTMNEVTNQLLSKAKRIVEAGHPTDAKRLFTEYTVDMIASLAFGYDINTLNGSNDVLHGHLTAIFPGLNKRMASSFPYWHWYKTTKDKKLEAAMSTLHVFLKERIVDVRQHLTDNPSLKESPENLLQALMTEQAQNSKHFSEDDVLANAITVLIAGEDTTANALCWLAYLLAKHPAIQAAVQEELDALPEEALNQWPLPQTPLLTACIHESMRLKPVAPFIFVEALRDCTVGDLMLPKNTKLVMLNNALCHEESHFPDPEVFNPYRWLEQDGCKISQMIPFGGGPRVCPGRSLALLEIKLAMSRLLQEFTINVIDVHQVRDRFAFVMMPENLSISFTSRT